MAEKECPCKNSLSDGQKGILNFGLNNNVLQNPNQAALDAIGQLTGRNGQRLLALAQTNDPFGQAFPGVAALQNNFMNYQNAVDAFAQECNKFTDIRSLSTIISSLTLYGDMMCALGIPGVDIGFGISVVNQNGQFAIQGALGVNLDLERLLNNLDGKTGTELANAVKDLQQNIDGLVGKMDEVNNMINSVVQQTQQMQAEAAAFIEKYTSLNSLANLVNLANVDPCFKLGSTVNGSLVSPQFLNSVRSGFSNTGGGGSFR